MDLEVERKRLEALLLTAAEETNSALTLLSNAGGCLLNRIISKIIDKRRAGDDEEPFYVLDLSVVINLMHKWQRNLPKIQPFYAVKCNPNPAILAVLAALGANFDCSSPAEIESALALGVSPDRIIFANPCKSRSNIIYAASVGVKLTTFDSAHEIPKIQKLHPECALLVRIKAPNETGSKYPLGSKCGANPDEVIPLLQAAQTAGLAVRGVSFHIGSKSTNSEAYTSAIATAKTVFEEAARLGMPRMNILNIGGGFVAGHGHDDVGFEEAAAAVKTAVETYFGDQQEQDSLEVMAEPGRFFAETAFSVAANIIGKRVRGEVREYWINEGTYGSMMFVESQALAASCIPLKLSATDINGGQVHEEKITYTSTVFGPTCDSTDRVFEGKQLPELEVNDWLLFRDMGAYTSACSTNFNGFGSASVTYLA